MPDKWYWFALWRGKMGISGVGSVNSYIYNMKTGKLSTKDGSHDEFVEYFNDDLKGEDSLALNGFDQQRKSGVKKMISLMGEMGLGKMHWIRCRVMKLKSLLRWLMPLYASFPSMAKKYLLSMRQ